MKNLNKTIALFLVFAMALTFCPFQSSAKYKDQSGDLPGTVSDGTIYALAGVAAVGIGVLVYVLIKKNKQKNTSATIIEYRKNNQSVMWENQLNVASTGDKTNLVFSSNQASAITIPGNTFMQQLENAAKTMPVDLLVSPINTGNNYSANNVNGVQVGVRIRF